MPQPDAGAHGIELDVAAASEENMSRADRRSAIAPVPDVPVRPTRRNSTLKFTGHSKIARVGFEINKDKKASGA